MAGRSWRSLIGGFLVLCTTTLAFAGEDASATQRDMRDFAKTKHSRPTWIRNLSHHGFDSQPRQSEDGLQLVLQRKRRDGSDLLTLRQTVATAGRLQAYAGVGLNRAVYLAAPTAGPTLLDKCNRHRSIGGAAEVGVGFRVTENVRLNAELRWIDIDRDAIAIRTKQGLVPADPVAFGVSFRWRFR